jgi:hypothetical protein
MVTVPFRSRAPHGARALAAVALLAAAVATPPARAGDEVIPPRPALTLLIHILSFDRHFVPKGDGDFVVAVVHEPGQKEELARAMEAAEAAKSMEFKKRAVQFVAVELRAPGPFRQALVKANASAMVLLPGLTPAGVETIVRVADEERLYTLSLDPTLVEKSAAIGVVKEGTRNRILLNRNALVRMKSSFEPTLLKLARIYM